MNNGIISLLDLGFLYSVLALAYNQRDQLKKGVKWSSKIETFYLQSDYKKMFLELDRSYNSYGQFNPTIRFVYETCFKAITERILKEVLAAYQMISFQKMEKMTGISKGDIQSFLKNNQALPYLFDPITQSIVYYEKNVPLYEEASSFFNVIKDRFDEKEKLLINDNRFDDEG